MTKLLLTCAFSLLCFSLDAAVQVKIIDISENEAAFEAAKIQHIDFTSNDTLSVIGKDGSILNKSEYAATKAIVFNTTQSGSKLTKKNTNISVYPNPTQEALHISGISENCAIRLYDANGKAIQNFTAKGSETEIGVSDLKSGTYVLVVGNKVVKFVKE